MAERAFGLVDRVYLDNYELMLLDKEGAAGQPEGNLSPFELADQASSTGAWFLVSANVAFIRSGYRFHGATVALELWHGEPPRGERWDKTVDTTIFLSSGEVYVTGGFPTSGKKLDLRDRGREWNVRANVRSLDRSPTNVRPPDNLEEFLIQFWCA